MATSLELAITAIRSNRKEEGRQLLNLLIQENPNNEMAWLWMSSVVNTDEQRARCLYHVLAINPDNQLARRGLQILGIVVSDSRPVKVPRDSQPIKIVTPTPAQSQFLPEVQAVPAAEERRPFRLDPQAVVAELPFKPITKPFTNLPEPAAPVMTTPAPINAQPAYPVPVEPAPPPGPVNMPVAPEPTPPPMTNTTVFDTGPLPVPQPVMMTQPPSAPYYPAQVVYAPQPGVMGVMQDTRPTPPVLVAAPPPSQPVPVVHSNVTMGMPYAQAQGYAPLPSPLHANVTMGMPTPTYSPGVAYGQLPHPSEPAPVVQPAAMPAYGQSQFAPPFQNPVFYSNSTMSMPWPGQPGMDYRATPNGAKAKKGREDEGEEEVNVLAVVIFGSLSVTALGGLGMLILLMFAS